jgi:hypothetical protein
MSTNDILDKILFITRSHSEVIKMNEKNITRLKRDLQITYLQTTYEQVTNQQEQMLLDIKSASINKIRSLMEKVSHLEKITMIQMGEMVNYIEQLKHQDKTISNIFSDGIDEIQILTEKMSVVEKKETDVMGEK